MDFQGLLIMLLKIVLSVVLSGIIGLDRSVKNRGAGLRTYIIVCMASTLVMMLSDYLYGEYATAAGGPDPARLGAQVISGIGFLGAGTIIQWRNTIKGLTTAAGLWGVACVGLAIGAGFYEGAVITIAVMYVVLHFVSKIEQDYVRKNKTIKLFVELYAPMDNMQLFTHCAESRGFTASKMDYVGKDTIDGKQVLFTLGTFKPNKEICNTCTQALDALGDLDFVKSLRVIDETENTGETDE